MTVLAGDVGGTHTRLALCRVGDGRPEVLERRTYASADHDGAGQVVNRFLHETGARVEAGCLAVPCPLEDGLCDFPNLHWSLDVGRVRTEVGMPGLRFINDFDAVGWGIAWLDQDRDTTVVVEGQADPEGNVAYLGAGTGLGTGFLVRRGGRTIVVESEGGHVDFAPRNEVECRLLLHLAERYGRASYERVISGPGLVDTYDFLVDEGLEEGSREVAERRREEDTAAVISENAMEGGDRAAVRALDLFMSVLGAQAGNLALLVRATGGVYVAGGIAPRILEALREGPFREAFHAKGRMADLVDRIPVRVILDEHIGIIGAAAAATHDGV